MRGEGSTGGLGRVWRLVNELIRGLVEEWMMTDQLKVLVDE